MSHPTEGVALADPELSLDGGESFDSVDTTRQPPKPTYPVVGGFRPSKSDPNRRSREGEPLGHYDRQESHRYKSKKWCLVQWGPIRSIDKHGNVQVESEPAGRGIILLDDNPGGQEMLKLFETYDRLITAMRVRRGHKDSWDEVKGHLYTDDPKHYFNGIRGCTENVSKRYYDLLKTRRLIKEAHDRDGGIIITEMD